MTMSMRKLKRASNAEQGFGMIELLVATVLLGIAIVGMMLGFAYASAGTRENRGRIQAAMLAQEALENLKQNDGVSTALDLNGYPFTTKEGYTVSVDEKEANGLSKLRAVTLKVEWKEAGVNRSLTMVEYIYLK
jgi:Tfp pilus assembly protein PilV